MRMLTAARIVVLDSSPERREELCKSLRELGLSEVTGIATVADAGKSGPLPDLFIVEGPSLADNDHGDEISANPFAASGVAAILLIPAATNIQRRKAIQAGYQIVIATPASPRLIYRRIGHVLQIARRVRRRRNDVMSAAPSRTIPELIEGDLPLAARLPAE